MSSRKRMQRGVTLIELMVAMALLAVIIAAAMGAFMGTNLAANQSYNIANLQGNSRLTLDALASDLRMAGLGASNGTIGIAPGGLWSMRVPTIYTSPVQTLKDPNGNTFTTRSIYILGADPATVGASAAGDGMEGVITNPLNASINCSKTNNAPTSPTAVDCSASSIGSDGMQHALLVGTGPGTFAPLMLHDHQRAAIILPTAISGFTGTAPQSISFSGSGGTVQPSPDPAAPFGFAQGFQVSRLRVVHWYLKQDANGGLPRLYRSKPVMTTATALTATSCANPFIDETNDSINGVAGTEIASGPIESLQVRFISDPAIQNDPTQYSMTDNIDPCTQSNIVSTMRQLREVRAQLVAISPTQAKDQNNKPILRYSTPTFEGSTASTSLDAYPRRAYLTRVAPRNFVPYRPGL